MRNQHTLRTLVAVLSFSSAVSAATGALAQDTGIMTAPGDEEAPPPDDAPPVPPDEEAVETIDLGVYDPLDTGHPEYFLDPLTTMDGLTMPDDGEVFMDAATGSAITACPNDPPASSWSRTWSRGQDMGNSTAGAGYEGKLAIQSVAGASGSPSKIRADATLRAYATLLGDSRNLAYAGGFAQVQDKRGALGVRLSVLGRDIYTAGNEATLEGQKTLTVTFFEASKTIMLGPVPVTFRGSASGRLAISSGAKVVENTLQLGITPSVEAYAQASAAVDVLFASAGVSGTVSLLKLSLPVMAKASVYPTQVSYSADVSLTATALSGHLDAFAKLGSKRWTYRLVSWPPAFSTTYEVLHVANCARPASDPGFCGDGVCRSPESRTTCAEDCSFDAPEDGAEPEMAAPGGGA